ncbi:hypothetical protein MHO82_24985 [Vibrio sp. Of7-15]|uniref:hypothetical protein n=1 Tax=Vibrio sp. Of7-15 TaxID=2724879 RepID=UPI001EF30846|nr:hypothetical protein [Vibrio sp. Of7-15]MCG7500122.1 hypothetical protein [Vibrio sp. Of7-15]
MKNKKWIFAAILIIGGPALLPFTLEFIMLVEVMSGIGVFVIYSSYAKYLLAHPYVKRFYSLVTCFDGRNTFAPDWSVVKDSPSLLVHALPVKSLLFWSTTSVVVVHWMLVG